MFKMWLKRITVFLLAMIVLGMLIKWRKDATYFDRYDPTVPLNAQSSLLEMIDMETDLFDLPQPRHYRKITATFESRPGENSLSSSPFPLKALCLSRDHFSAWHRPE